MSVELNEYHNYYQCKIKSTTGFGLSYSSVASIEFPLGFFLLLYCANYNCPKQIHGK